MHIILFKDLLRLISSLISKRLHITKLKDRDLENPHRSTQLIILVGF